MRRAAVLTVLAAAAVAASFAPGAGGMPLPGVPHCPLFPRSFSTNQRVDRLPVAQGSDAIVRSIGLDDAMHADFGSGRYEGRRIGIPYDVVTRRTRRSRVRFDYAAESDRVRYPIPRGVHVEGGGDRHALLWDRGRCRLYELFDLEGRPGAWTAGSGATWNLRSKSSSPWGAAAAPGRGAGGRGGPCAQRGYGGRGGRARPRGAFRSCRCSRAPPR